MKVLGTKAFMRFTRREEIADASLLEAITRADAGLIDADLGGGVIKQRISRPGEGKSGGYRTIVLFRSEVRAVFVFGFAKNDRANIGQQELRAFRKLASTLLDMTDVDIAKAIASETLKEIGDA